MEERITDSLRRKKDLASTPISIDEIEKHLTRGELLAILKDEISAVSASHSRTD